MSVHKKYFHQKTSGHPRTSTALPHHVTSFGDKRIWISAMAQCLDKPGTPAKCGASSRCFLRRLRIFWKDPRGDHHSHCEWNLGVGDTWAHSSAMGALYLVYMLCCMCVCVSFHEHELVCESGTGILFQIHTYPRHPFGEAGGSPQNSVLRVHWPSSVDLDP